MFDDQKRWLESIDTLVIEKREELEELYQRFFDAATGQCRCPLSIAIEKQIAKGEFPYE